jgi:hypothetical protein
MQALVRARGSLLPRLLGTAAFLFLALFSYCPETDPGFFQSISPQPKEVKNLGGPVGA